MATTPFRTCTTDDPSVEAVLDAEREWTRAHLENDLATLELLMADEYTQVTEHGGLARKTEVLASFIPGARHWDVARSDQHEIQVYGHTAVVIGRWRGKGVNNGTAFDYMSRYVSVWVWREARWQMVSDQSTPITS